MVNKPVSVRGQRGPQCSTGATQITKDLWEEEGGRKVTYGRMDKLLLSVRLSVTHMDEQEQKCWTLSGNPSWHPNRTTLRSKLRFVVKDECGGGLLSCVTVSVSITFISMRPADSC